MCIHYLSKNFPSRLTILHPRAKDHLSKAESCLRDRNILKFLLKLYARMKTKCYIGKHTPS